MRAETLFTKLLAARRWVFGFWCACLVVAGVGLADLNLSYDTRGFFNPVDGDYLLFKSFEDKYTKADTVLFLVQRHDRAPVTDVAGLRELWGLAEDVWQLPHISRVDSLLNYKRGTVDSETLGVVDLVTEDSLEQGQPSLEDVQTLALNDATIYGRLISKDLTSAAIWATVTLPDQADVAVDQINAAALRISREFAQTHPEYRVFVGGMVPLMAAFADAALDDFRVLVPLSLLVSALVIALLIRQWRTALALLLTVGFSAFITVGCASLAGHTFNTATVILPIVVAVLVLAAGLHVVFSVSTAAKDIQNDRVVVIGLATVLKPSCLALATTIAGFLSFNFADAPPLRQLGNLVAAGLAVGYLMLFTLLPNFLVYCAVKPTMLGEGFIQWLGGILAKNSTAAGLMALILAAISIPGLFALKVDDNFSEYFDQRFSYRQAIDAVSRSLGGVNVIEFDLVHPSNGQVTDPDYVAAVITLSTWLRQRNDVSYAGSFVDPLIQVARSVPERHGKLPLDQAGLAEYVFLYELSLANGEALTDMISVERNASRMQVALQNLSSEQIREFLHAADLFIQQQGYFDKRSFSTGLTALFASLTINNVASMLSATIYSMLFISCFIGLALGRLYLVLCCVIVTLLPLLTGFGLWGYLKGDLGLPGAVISALTIGIVIDDTVHFLHRYQEARRGMDVSPAIERAFFLAGRPMLFTTIALTLGFLVLTQSGFLINAHLGLFAAMIFVLALIACFASLPGMLKWSEWRRTKKLFEQDPAKPS